FSVGCAAFMPWGGRWQGLINLVCLSSFFIDKAYSAGASGFALYRLLGLLLVLLLAQVIATFIDRYRRQLIEARQAAIAGSLAKSQFLASMSHEMRTPLNAIIGTTELLWETELGAEQREYLRICRTNGEALLS